MPIKENQLVPGLVASNFPEGKYTLQKMGMTPQELAQ